MSYLLGLLVTLRLLMWRIYPHYGTGIFSDSIFYMMALTGLVLYLINKRYTKFTPWLFLWICAAGTSVFYSPNIAVSFTAWFILLTNILTFSLAIRYLRDQESVNTLWVVMILGAVAAGAVGIWEFFILRIYPVPTIASPALVGIYQAKRSCSFLGWPTVFAGYLILFIPSVWLYFKHSVGKKKVFWLVCLITVLLGLVSSFSVLAPLSLVAAIIISGSTKRLKWVLITIGLVIFMAGSTKTFITFFNARQEYIQEAWRMICAHPFIGQGIGTFQSTGGSKSTFAHNSYLQIWAETGPIGLIGVLGFVYTFWKMKPKTHFGKGMYIGLLAFFIDNLFSFTLIKPNLSFAGWLALACYFVYYKMERKRNGILSRH